MTDEELLVRWRTGGTSLTFDERVRLQRLKSARRAEKRAKETKPRTGFHWVRCKSCGHMLRRLETGEV